MNWIPAYKKCIKFHLLTMEAGYSILSFSSTMTGLQSAVE